MNAAQRLSALQKKITDQLQKDVVQILGKTPKSIQAYERRFLKEFKKTQNLPKRKSKEDLIREIRAHSVTLVADYHTYAQAQRTALRLLRDAVLPNENWALALEMFSSEHQPLLDKLCAKKISIPDFLEELDYESTWGFPWSNYAPLLEWALEHKIPLYGLNRPAEFKQDKTRSDLEERDRWAAGIITDLVIHKKCRVLALYGELHLAQEHLPKQIQQISKSYSGQALSTLTIHQNHDAFYWKQSERGKLHDAHTLKMREHVYCILSGTPWNKLQSVISWAEGFSEESEIDPTSILHRNIEHLSEFFRLTLPSTAHLEVKTLDDAHFISSRKLKIKSSTRKLCEQLVSLNQRFYLPEVGLFYVSQTNPNHLADLAAAFLFCRIFKIREFIDQSPDHQARLTTQFAFSFFGSLVLNPKRKCDLLKDHENRIKELKKGSKPFFRDELKSHQLVLAFFKNKGWPSKKQKPSLSIQLSAQWVGEILGKKLYQAMLSDEFEMGEFRALLTQKNLSWTEKNKRLLEWSQGAFTEKSKKDLL